MAKRFTDTDIWDEDWYQDLPNKYKLFFNFVKDKCDNAGIWRPNKNNFQKIIGEPIVMDEFLMLINQGKERIMVLPSGKWFLKYFFIFQYGEEFKPLSPVHRGALKQLVSNGVSPLQIIGISLDEKIQSLDIEGFREIAYSKDIKTLLIDLGYPLHRVKDKDKDKDKVYTGMDEEKIKFWFLKFYNSDYKNYKSVFNGQSATEDVFLIWKNFIDFIYEKRFEEVLETKFINPKDFGELIEKGFSKEKWEPVLQSILATGVKPEHNLFFRIPQFMDYEVKPATTIKHPKSGEIYL